MERLEQADEAAGLVASMTPLERLLEAMLVGDSLGLPAEGLNPARLRKLGWNPWKQRLLFGWGMGSDDTDHAVFTAKAVAGSKGDPDQFSKLLAREFKRWMATIPPAVGGATARAGLRLLLGCPPHRAGVRSAGNGPAMRSPVIGALFPHDPANRRRFVEISTRLTHTDPRALTGAMAVADGVAWALQEPDLPAQEICRRLRERQSDAEWLAVLEQVEQALAEEADVAGLASRLGLTHGVSGYMFHTVPVAIFGWLRHRGRFADGLAAVLDAGGDTDTVGAIYAALASTDLNESNPIPAAWREQVAPTPATGFSRATRHLLMLTVILWHGLVIRPLPASLARKLVP